MNDQPAASPKGGRDDNSVSAIPEQLPVVPLKNMVVLPYVFSPLVVSRLRSVAAVEAALGTEEKMLVAVAQLDGQNENPSADQLHTVGTQVVIKRLARDGDVLHALVQGIHRVRIDEYLQSDPFLKARVSVMDQVKPEQATADSQAMHRAIMDLVGEMLELAHPERAAQLQGALQMADDPWHLVFLLASMMQLNVDQEQALLEADSHDQALQLVHQYLQHEVNILRLRNQIAEKAKSQMGKQEREYLLRQQLKAIQEELGELAPGTAGDLQALKEKLDSAQMPEQVKKEAERELGRLGQINPASPDHQLTRAYLELLAELPWSQSTTDNMDLSHARTVLDEDHYGLEEIKDRILEFLAVMKLNPQAHAPILCFVGPPGVGKTSLGQSIARALGRRFERMSLGGMHDEAELRGHRRTYIGAMPGRIIQAVRRAGVNNPLMMLDEIDKLGRDFRGDPASAMLEILDPAQNHQFRDNYLDLPFDLSRVLFIATANSLDAVPRPLLDRMEIIRLSGYTLQEKTQIARRYLIPRQLKEKGLQPEQMQIPDEALVAIVQRFTREAGVRQLERAIGRVARKIALRVAEGQATATTIRTQDLASLLGKAMRRPEEQRPSLPIGVATGLAWTQTGGEVLYIEAVLLPRGKGLKLTGQLGNVMRESAEAAQSFIWAHAAELDVSPDRFQKFGVHIHVPAGAVPKDGPSAGVAMLAALASLYLDRPTRRDTAMTGEITLAGDVLPIGGVKEKSLAAHAAGIRRVILPKDNEEDLRDVPEEIREQLEFVFVQSVQQLIEQAIENGIASEATHRSKSSVHSTDAAAAGG